MQILNQPEDGDATAGEPHLPLVLGVLADANVITDLAPGAFMPQHARLTIAKRHRTRGDYLDYLLVGLDNSAGFLGKCEAALGVGRRGLVLNEHQIVKWLMERIGLWVGLFQRHVEQRTRPE